MNFDFDSQTRRKLGYQLIEVVDRFFASLADRSVQPAAEDRIYPPRLSRLPETGEDPSHVLEQVCGELVDNGFHVPSAHYLGMMNPTPTYMAFLAESLVGAGDGYTFVFLDCPPSLGPLTVNALAAADRVLVPVQAEYYALEGLTQLLRSVELVRQRLNPRLALAGVLLTMVDRRTKLAAQVEQEVRQHLGELVFETTVPRSVRLAEAPSHGLPAIAYDRSSSGAQAYWKVAMELVERS